MIRSLLFTAAALLLFAGPAFADSEAWIDGCNDSPTANAHALLATPTTSALVPGERACAISATQTNETLVLDVSACNHVDILQFLDADGDGTESTVVGQVQLCPNSFDDDDACDDFGLTVFTASDTFLEGLGASYIRIASAGTTDADLVRWEVRCIGRAAGN